MVEKKICHAQQGIMSEVRVCKASYKLRDSEKGYPDGGRQAYAATALRNMMIQGSRGGGANRAVWP